MDLAERSRRTDVFGRQCQAGEVPRGIGDQHQQVIGSRWSERSYRPVLPRQRQRLARRYGVASIQLVREQQVQTVRLGAPVKYIEIAIALRAHSQGQIRSYFERRLAEIDLH